MTLPQFDVQHRINSTNCSRARAASIIRLITRSAVVVSTKTTVPPEARLFLVAGITVATPTKTMPTIEARPKIVAAFAS